MPMTTKLNKMVTYLDEILLAKSHNLKSRLKLNSLYLHYHRAYDHQV